jgi:hypothetical protein
MATFLDDYSRYFVVALMKKKGDIGVAFASFRRFMSQTAKLRDNMVINIEFEDTDILPNDKFSEGFHVIRLRSDNAKEYKHIENSEAHKDINKTYSGPYTPQHNSIAERVSRIIMDPARSTMLIHAGLPDTLKPFAVKNVVKVRNRLPHSTTKTTPFEMLTGARPNLKSVRVFGCAAFPWRMP